MAKKNSLKLGKRAAKLLKRDLLHSVAMASILLNILFLVGWAVVTYGDADQEAYDLARNRLCVDNYSKNLQKAVKDSTTTEAAQVAALEFKIQCVSDDFKPYYENAIETYTQTKTSQ